METKEGTDIRAMDRFRFVLGAILGVAALIVLSFSGG
jgi:hypothetical protein